MGKFKLQMSIKEMILYVAGGSAVVCSIIGYLILYNADPIKAIYKTLSLFGGNADLDNINVWIYIAVFFAPIAMTTAFILLFLEFFKEHWFFWKKAKGHCVVIGLGNMGLTLVNDILSSEPQKAKKLLVIEFDKNNPHIQELKDRGVMVLIGDASSASILQKAKIIDSDKIICFAGKDLINLEVAIQIAKQFPSMLKKAQEQFNFDIIISDKPFTF